MEQWIVQQNNGTQSRHATFEEAFQKAENEFLKKGLRYTFLKIQS